MVGAQDQVDLSLELLLGLSERVLGHPETAALGHRLDDRRERHLQVAIAAAMEDLVARRLQSVAFEQPLGHHLVAAATERLIAAAGVDVSHRPKQARHFRLAEPTPAQALDQVEDDRTARVERAHRRGDVVPHRRQVHRADFALQRLGHVARDLLGLFVGQQVLRASALLPEGQAVEHDHLDGAQIGDAPRQTALARSWLDQDIGKEVRIRRSELESLEFAGRPIVSALAVRRVESRAGRHAASFARTRRLFKVGLEILGGGRRRCSGDLRSLAG